MRNKIDNLDASLPVDLVQIEAADAEMRLRQAFQLIVRSALRAQRGQLGETETPEVPPDAWPTRKRG